MGLFGPPNVEKLKAKRNVKKLIKALTYNKEYDTRRDPVPGAAGVRESAARALGEIGDACAVEPLLAALDDDFYQVTNAVKSALSQIGVAAVQPLIAALNEDNRRVRQAAAVALGDIGDERAVEPLTAALQDRSISVREAAAEALGQIGTPQAVQSLLDVLEDKEERTRGDAAKALGAIGDPQAVQPLIAALKDKDARLRENAARALGQIGAPAVESLIAVLTNKAARERKTAAETLGQIGDARAVEPLINALRDGNSDVRAAAAVALDTNGWQPDQGGDGAAYWVAMQNWDRCLQIGAPAVQPLIAALTNKAARVRKAAVETLSQIGDKRAVEPLIAALKDRAKTVRQAAIQALGDIGGQRAVEPLIASLKDTSMRRFAEQSLTKIGAPAIEPLVTQLVDGDREVCQSAVLILNNLGWQPDEGAAGTVYCVIHKQWDRCVQIGASAVEPLIAAIEDQDQNTRRAAATALGQIGDRRAVKPLAAVLKDKSNSDDVRQAAIQALGQIGDAHAVKPLIAALKHGGNDDNVRRAAAEALGQIGDASAVKSLGIALKYKSLEVRKAAVQALGQIGAPAIEPLTAALNHAYGIQVRIDAATELDNLGWQPDEGVAGAAYWVIRKEWDRSVQIGAPAVEPLIAALASIGFRTCEAAAQALGQIGDARAVKPLIAALKEKNRTERERQAAAQALGQIGDARAVKPLVSVLKDKNNENDVRRAAAEALGQIGDARAVKPLIGMLQHSDRIIRRAAAITLVALHQSGRLDEKHQRLIVAERPRITASHVDAHKVTGHTDIDRSGQPSDCSHIDTTPTRHADYGIGVTFPA